MTLRDFAIKYGFIILLVGLIVFFTLATDGFGSPQASSSSPRTAPKAASSRISISTRT
jgi:hypothetical protein